MIPSSTIAFMISLLIDNIYCYLSFIFIFVKDKKNKKIFLFIPSIIIGWIIGAILNDFFRAAVLTDLVYIIVLYKIFFRENFTFKIMNKILLFILIEKIVGFFLNFPINILGFYHIHQHIIWILFSETAEIIATILIFNKITPIILEVPFANKESKSMFYIFSLYTIFIDCYYIYMHLTKKYNHLLLISFTIITISTIVLVFMISILKKYLDSQYKEQFIHQQLTSMVQYTEIIERNQLQLRRFKHDYKNILFAMTNMIENNQIDELKKYMTSLTNYSNLYLKQSIEKYRDIHNVNHQLLKSMITMKLMELDSLNIPFTFECLTSFDTTHIEDFDLVRMVGILLDNAKEYLQEIGTGHLNILIINTEELTEISIANTYLSDDKSIEHFKEIHYSSKNGHDGLGLSNIEEIKQKYDNLFIQYEKNDTFIVKIIILNHERS